MDHVAALIRLDRAVRDAQSVLRDHLLTGMSDADALRKVRDILDEPEFLRFQRSLEGIPEASEEEPRGPEDPLPYR